MELKLNPNEKLVEGIKNGTLKKEGHCPCLIFATEETVCPFFANNEYPEFANVEDVCVYSQQNYNVAETGCHCQLYIPNK